MGLFRSYRALWLDAVSPPTEYSRPNSTRCFVICNCKREEEGGWEKVIFLKQLEYMNLNIQLGNNRKWIEGSRLVCKREREREEREEEKMKSAKRREGECM